MSSSWTPTEQDRSGMRYEFFRHVSKGKMHPCTGTEALYRPYAKVHRCTGTEALYRPYGKVHPCTGTEALYRPYGL
jgi:hypothetical protein